MYEYSFIVPVYNAEKYIEECIFSILKQGEHCELILIDDGSSDASGNICDNYAKKYERVSTYHIENSGPAGARNYGLSKSSGKYIIFVDADDYLSEDFIEKFEDTDADKSADLVFFNIVKKFPDGREEDMSEGLCREKLYKKSYEEILKALSECSKFPASTGGKIVKKEVLENNNISFKRGLIGEDIDWTLQLVCNIKSADFFTCGKYYYRISTNTRRSYGNVKSLADQLFMIENWLQKAKGTENEKYILSFLAFQYAVTLPFYGALPSKDRKPYAKRVKELKFLLSHGKTKKILFIRIASDFLGVAAASVLLYKYVTQRDVIKT